MDIQIGNSGNIWLLTVVASGLVITGYSIVARRRAALKFATARLRRQILPPRGQSRHWISAILIATSLGLLSIALMDIRWGKTLREVPQKGIEVMFVLDVSRSMLAEDVTPNRLSRAKQQIKDMVDEMKGDRVGLVVFAGDTRQSVPLTSHYEDFRQTLDSVGPHTVRVGGSRLGDALKAAANGFISKTNDHKAIVVFTDGEDQESKPDAVARELHAEKGIRIFTVGLGDMDQGARIPETQDQKGGFVQYEGQQVWSKMNGQILSQIATDTDGAYIPAGTRNVNMADVYHGYVANVEQTEFETAKINAYIARYQWFAAPAFLLMLLEIWISTRTKPNQQVRRNVPNALQTDDPSAAKSNTGSGLSRTATTTAGYTAAVFITLTAAAASAQTPQIVRQSASEINAANALLRDGKVDEALDAYRKVVPGHQQRDALQYNQAVAEYRKGNLETAARLFTEVAGTNADAIAADSRYNLGNCQYANALQMSEKDKPTAISLLRDAIANYRGSLRVQPNNSDARANIELAAELIRRLEEEQKKEEEQKQQQQQEPDKSQEQDQQDKDQQQDHNEQSDQQQQNEQKQEQPNKSQDSEAQNSDSQKDQSQQDESQNSSSEQKSESQNSESEHQKPEQQKNQDQQERDASPSDQSPTNEPKSSDPQKSAQQQTQPQKSDSRQQQHSGDPQKQEDEGQPEVQNAKDQPVPTGDLKAASEQKDNNNPEGKAEMSDSNVKGGLMTREEALKMLQSVRDRDMLRRMQQQRQERSRRVPVEKDW